MPEHEPFALGGIWSIWTNKETAEVHTTCSIITTPANELMSRIHNTKKRMPLILNRDTWDTWLSDHAPKEKLEPCMQILPDGHLHAHRISKLITSRTEDSNVAKVQSEYKDSLF
jgi:putative SOS response-associated peptidase YedK